MNNLKKRRESVATVCRKTTKFLTSNTANLLKKVPNTRKYRLLARLVEDNDADENQDFNAYEEDKGEDAAEDLGDRDLDYYLGVRKQETFWRDLDGRDQIRKDFFLNHRGLSEEDYDKLFSKPTTRLVSFKQPKLKQVPFKITRKKHRKNESLEGESWKEKAAIFKLFTNRKDSDTTSDSYSECDSSDGETLNNDMLKNDEEDRLWRMVQHFNDTIETYEGVRIKEVSEGRPCDNCPELCPGFISHPWSNVRTRLVFCAWKKCRALGRASACRTRIEELKSKTIRHNQRSRRRGRMPVTMCMAMKNLEWAEIYRRIRRPEVAEGQEKKIQKFPSRERNHAVRRKNNNNNLRSHANCETCARVAAKEAR